MPVAFSTHAARYEGAAPALSLADLMADETPAVMTAFAAIRPEWTAQYLLTSGSTGVPKVVINTHRMLCANQKQMSQVWPFLTRHQLRLLDWLPWSHTFGGNHNFNMVLSHGGSLYVDEGRPVPGVIEKTVANLREVQPNFHFNVPRGFDMLLPVPGGRRATRARRSSEPRRRVYAGAALPQSLLGAVEALAQGAQPAAVVHLVLGRDRGRRRPPPGCTGASTAPAASACRSRASS